MAANRPSKLHLGKSGMFHEPSEKSWSCFGRLPPMSSEISRGSSPRARFFSFSQEEDDEDDEDDDELLLF
jgi:hypothetical protein